MSTQSITAARSLSPDPCINLALGELFSSHPARLGPRLAARQRAIALVVMVEADARKHGMDTGADYPVLLAEHGMAVTAMEYFGDGLAPTWRAALALAAAALGEAALAAVGPCKGPDAEIEHRMLQAGGALALEQAWQYPFIKGIEAMEVELGGAVARLRGLIALEGVGEEDARDEPILGRNRRQRRADIRRVVAQSPGLTSKEIASEVGHPRGTVAPDLAEMQRAGLIVCRGRGYWPA